jgi:hypothetical protein
MSAVYLEAISSRAIAHVVVLYTKDSNHQQFIGNIRKHVCRTMNVILLEVDPKKITSEKIVMKQYKDLPLFVVNLQKDVPVRRVLKKRLFHNQTDIAIPVNDDKMLREELHVSMHMNRAFFNLPVFELLEQRVPK